jgi:hypothetical protein
MVRRATAKFMVFFLLNDSEDARYIGLATSDMAAPAIRMSSAAVISKVASLRPVPQKIVVKAQRGGRSRPWRR